MQLSHKRDVISNNFLFVVAIVMSSHSLEYIKFSIHVAFAEIKEHKYLNNKLMVMNALDQDTSQTIALNQHYVNVLLRLKGVET